MARWIFACGMPRSGSTLQYQITCDLVESCGAGQALGWISPPALPALIRRYQDFDGYLVIKTHTFTDLAAKLFDGRCAMAIYVYRDIRDVVVSLMRKYALPLETVLTQSPIASLLQNYYAWTALQPRLVSRYETMVSDLSGEVRRIAKFLDLRIDVQRSDQIANARSLQNQLTTIAAFDFQRHGAGANSDVYDPVSLLHKNHIHSGATGQWKDALSNAQVALLEAQAYGWIVQHGYPISQSALRRKLALLRLPDAPMKHTIHRFVARAQRFMRHVRNGTLAERLYSARKTRTREQH